MRKINTVKLVSVTSSRDKANRTAEGRSGRNIAMLIAVWLVVIAALVPCNSGLSRSTQNPSPVAANPEDTAALNGATLLDTRCSICHSADKPRQAKKTHEQWEQTVTRMISHGARLTEAEKKVLLDYLAKTYGP